LTNQASAHFKYGHFTLEREDYGQRFEVGHHEMLNFTSLEGIFENWGKIDQNSWFLSASKWRQFVVWRKTLCFTLCWPSCLLRLQLLSSLLTHIFALFSFISECDQWCIFCFSNLLGKRTRTFIKVDAIVLSFSALDLRSADGQIGSSFIAGYLVGVACVRPRQKPIEFSVSFRLHGSASMKRIEADWCHISPWVNFTDGDERESLGNVRSLVRWSSLVATRSSRLPSDPNSNDLFETIQLYIMLSRWGKLARRNERTWRLWTSQSEVHWQWGDTLEFWPSNLLHNDLEFSQGRWFLVAQRMCLPSAGFFTLSFTWMPQVKSLLADIFPSIPVSFRTFSKKPPFLLWGNSWFRFDGGQPCSGTSYVQIHHLILCWNHASQVRADEKRDISILAP
jgi:hypothetical protein